MLYIIADAHTGLFLESTRQIVFRITGQFCKILCTDFFSGVHLDIVPAFCNGGGKLRILSGFVYPPDEIVIHQCGNGTEFIVDERILSGLHIGVPEGISRLRGQTALYGGAADNGSKYDDRGLCLS